jgi:hypothetical protein
MWELTDEEFEDICGGGEKTEKYAPGYASAEIAKIKDPILSNYPGNSRLVHRVHGDPVIVSNVTPSFRSVWSVFGDVSGMSGLIKSSLC